MRYFRQDSFILAIIYTTMSFSGVGMEIGSASSSALQGLLISNQGVRQNAAEIASADQFNGSATRSLAEPLVENIQYELQAGASAQIIKTVDQMLGAILDVKA
jgi:hypothetical protein